MRGFCDVDPAKIALGRYHFQKTRANLPIVHFRDGRPPFVICVASKRAGSELEAIIAGLGLVEGIDYFHFC